MSDPGARAVVDRYLGAMASGDRPALWDCFTEDVVYVCREHTIRGREACAEEWERLLHGIFAPGTYTRHVDSLVIEGDVGVLVWRADCLGTEVTHGVTHFFARDGRIALVTSVVQSRPV